MESIYSEMLDLLPKTNDHRIWTDGEQILVENFETAEHIADFIDALYGYPITATGHYDPKEDEQFGTIDDHTGWHYVIIP